MARVSVSKTEDEGSSPYVRANSLLVQRIRTFGYGPEDRGSNPLETTQGRLAERFRLKSAKLATQV